MTDEPVQDVVAITATEPEPETTSETATVVQASLLSTPQVANVLSVTPQTIRRWVRKGKLRPTGSMGAVLFFTREDIDKAVADGLTKDPRGRKPKA